MRTETRIQTLIRRFEKKFHESPKDIFSSPGRIELLGNHTDHNRGKVLVSSVNLNILAAVAPRDDGRIIFYSHGYKRMEISLSRLKIRENEYGTSQALIRGVLFRMKQLGYRIGGFSVTSDSTIFKGAGVSSSAAFEVLIAKILSVYYNGDSISAFGLAEIAQFAESVYFHKPCGLLDQSGIALGGVNFIDFRSTEKPEIKSVIPHIHGYQFLLINTGDDHTKLTPHYAQIKDDMKAVAAVFGKEYLREVEEKEFADRKDEVIRCTSERAYLRAKHFFEENERVQEAYDALLRKDIVRFFQMMDQSGISSYYQLKNCYVESEKEKLPSALRFAKEIDPECYCRVHGGGFAGTMLMIVRKEKVKDLLPKLEQLFSKENVMKVSLSDRGTHLLRHLESEGEDSKVGSAL